MFAKVPDDKRGLAACAVGAALVLWSGAAVAGAIQRIRRVKELEARGEEVRRVRELGRAELDELASKGTGMPSVEERWRLAQLSAVDVCEEIRSGKVSCETVMLTACLNALAAGRALECNAVEMFGQALEASRAADKKLAEKGPNAVGRLHGLPISIKDQIDVAGTDSTSGMLSRCCSPMSKDAAIVASLKAEGAIPFCKSNVPMLLMVPESLNRIFGRSRNPWAADRTPGGSSGGEGALIGAFGSWLGIGTDIGGSIRIPAHFSGVAGFKPTPERISSVGCSASSVNRRSGQTVVRGVAGPMARRVSDLRLMLQVWLDRDSAMYTNDPALAPVHFQSATRAEKPRIGVFVDDGWFECAPSCARAVDETCSALREAGYEVVPFKVPEPNDYVRLYVSAVSSDGGMQNMRSGLDGEPLLEEYSFMYRISRLPSSIRRFLAWVHDLIGQNRTAHVLRAGEKRSVIEYWNVVAELMAYRSRFIEEMRKAGVEALLCPGGTLPAMPHGASGRLFISMSSTFLFNLLHFPAGTVPVTRTRPDECTLEFKHPGGDSFARKAAATLLGADGLPIGVQVVTLPWQDELALDIMQDIESHFKFHEKHAKALSFLK